VTAESRFTRAERDAAALQIAVLERLGRSVDERLRIVAAPGVPPEGLASSKGASSVSIQVARDVEDIRATVARLREELQRGTGASAVASRMQPMGTTAQVAADMDELLAQLEALRKPAEGKAAAEARAVSRPDS
jgi:hypothetical protein